MYKNLFLDVWSSPLIGLSVIPRRFFRHSVHYFGSRSCGAEELRSFNWEPEFQMRHGRAIWTYLGTKMPMNLPKTGSLYHRDETVCWFTVRYELHKYRNLQAQKDIIDYRLWIFKLFNSFNALEAFKAFLSILR